MTNVSRTYESYEYQYNQHLLVTEVASSFFSCSPCDTGCFQRYTLQRKQVKCPDPLRTRTLHALDFSRVSRSITRCPVRATGRYHQKQTPAKTQAVPAVFIHTPAEKVPPLLLLHYLVFPSVAYIIFPHQQPPAPPTQP